MMPKGLKKSLQVAGIVIPTLAFGFLSVPHTVRADTQPEMQKTLNDLTDAQANLEKATHDKGGHRVKALKLVQQAIGEVNAGMAFDNSHTGKMENKK
jgi:hypothetical protein